MEEEDAFIQNLASMLEVSLVEDTNSMVTLTAAEESTGNSGETKQNNISVNGVAHTAQESVSEAKSTDVSCTPVEEQVKAQGAPDPDSQSPSKSVLTHVPFFSENALETALDFGHHELLTSENQSQTSVGEEEKQLYYSYFKDLKRVMYLRLHCTVCDCHIGCTPAAVSLMAFHKVLRVLICSDCENFYGNGDFVCGDDGSETFCRWCGQGGQLYCCSHCPSVFCKKCIRRNLGRKTVKVIEESNEWTCYRCNVRPLWQHRALCWGLSSFLKEQSDEKTKVLEDVADKTPGFNSLLCCEGEKLPYYRTSQPLRPIVCPATSNTLKVKNIQSLMTPSNKTNILHNALTSGVKALEPTVPSPAIKTSSDTAVNPVVSFSNSSQLVSVVTSLAKSNDEHLTLSKNPNSYNVSDSKMKAPEKRGGGKTNSTIFVPNNQLKLTYESVFLNHLAQSGAQSQTQNQNRRPRQNSAIPVTARVSDCIPVNVGASVPLMYVQGRSGTILMPSTSSSTAGPTVNQVCINQSKTSENLTRTIPALNVAPAQCIQHGVITHIPTTGYAISGGPNVLSKAVPISSFCNPPPPSSGHTQFTRPPCPNMSPQKNVVNDVQMKDISVIDSDDNDDDIFVVFSKLQNLTDEQNAGHEWMIKALAKTDRASRILAYNVEVLKQTLKLRNKKKEMSTKTIRHLAGKFYRLLKKASKSLNFQREFLSKEFSDWLNAEKTKRGIPTTKEREPSSSPAKDKTPDAETTEEPELLLDMEISCESDHEDISSPVSGVQKEQIECNENLSDSETDSDDPFSDSENSNWKNVVQATCRPFLSRTVKELLRDKVSSKLLLQLLTEKHSKTADPENKQISSRKEFQLTDASTETAAPGKEELATGKNECNISTLKHCVYTSELPEQISDSGSSVHSVQIDVGSGNEKDSVDLISEAIQKSLMESFSSRTDDMAGNEGSYSHKTPCNNGGTSLDPLNEAMQKSLMESSSSRTDDMAGNEGSNSHKTPCNNGETSLDPISEAIQNSLMESSSSRTDDMAVNEGSNSHKTPCNNNGMSLDPISEAIQNSLMETSSSRTDDMAGSERSYGHKTPCNHGGTSLDLISEAIQNSLMESSSSRTDDMAGSEGSYSHKTPCNNGGTSLDPISGAIQNSLMESSSSRTDDMAGSEGSYSHKTPCNNGGTSLDPISEAIQNSLMESSSSRTDDMAGSEGSNSHKAPCSNGTSLDPISEAIQNSLLESSSSRTDDMAGSEGSYSHKTPCNNGGTSLDPISEAMQNSLMESSSSRTDDMAGSEGSNSHKAPCSNGTSLDPISEAIQNSLLESSSSRTDDMAVNEGSNSHKTPCNNGGTSLDPISEAMQNSLLESSSSRTDDMAVNEGSNSHKTPCNNSGTSLDPISEAMQNSLLESSSSRTDDMAGSEGSYSHKTPCNNGGTSLDPISGAVQNSLMESSSSRTDDMAVNEGSNSHKTPCNNSGTSLDPISEAIQNSLLESSSSRTDDMAVNEGSNSHKTPCNNSGTSLDPISEAMQNSLLESSSSRTDDMAGSEGSYSHKTPCNNGGTSLDPISGAVQNSLMESSSSRTDDMAGSEGSYGHKTPCNNGGTSLDPISEAIQNSLLESSSSRTDECNSEQSLREETPCNDGGMKSVDIICEPVQNSPKDTSTNRTDKKKWSEESCRSKTPYSNSGISSVDPISKSNQNSPAISFCSITDDKTENEESQNKTPHDNSKTESGNPISEAVENSLMNCSTRIDNKSSNEGSHREKNLCISSGMASVDPVTETIQSSSVEISPSRTDDNTKDERTPRTNGETEPVDAVSEAVHNSLMESYPAREDNKTGIEELGTGETSCEYSSIDSAQNFVTHAETNKIHTRKPLQKKTASKRSCSAVNRKRKYQCISSNDMSSDGKENSCGSERRAAKTVRTDSPRTDSSSSSVVVPIINLEKTEVPVNDYTALVHSAVQKKLIKPCFVSVVKLTRNN